MGSLSLKKEGNVFIVSMDDQQTANTFTDDVIKEHMDVLDQIDQSSDKGAVVLTSSNPKFWSNGINLEWLLAQGSDYVPTFKDNIDALIVRWALLKRPTIACLTGHAFGGGAILSCGFDFRIMRSDRGYFCFPEIDVNIPFTDIMHEVISLLPNRQALYELAYTGRRVGGEEALKLQVVDRAFTEVDLLPKTLEIAELLGSKNLATYKSIKYGFKKNLLKHLG